LILDEPRAYPTPKRVEAKMSDAIVVTKSGRADITGSEGLVTIHCQECGEQITDAETANVIFPRTAEAADTQPFKIVCLDCDRHRDMKAPTSWMKLHEFIEALAASVEMKAKRKSNK
jgi:hypothetical protein